MTAYVLIDGAAHLIRGVKPAAPASGNLIARDGDIVWVHFNGQTYALEYRDAVTHLAAAETQAGTLRAPMPGLVVAVGVATGDKVAAGDMLMIIESMKLETVIAAPHEGTVAAVHFTVDDRFNRNALLVSLEETD